MRRRRRHSYRSWRCGGAPVASCRLRVRSGATGADERGRRSSPDAGAGIVRARCQQRLGRTAASLIRVPGRIPGPEPVCRRIGQGGTPPGERVAGAGGRDDGRMEMMSPPAGQLPVGCAAGCREGSRRGGGSRGLGAAGRQGSRVAAAVSVSVSAEEGMSVKKGVREGGRGAASKPAIASAGRRRWG